MHQFLCWEVTELASFRRVYSHRNTSACITEKNNQRHAIALHGGVLLWGENAATHSAARGETRRADEYYNTANGYHSGAASETKLIDHYQHIRAVSLCQRSIIRSSLSPLRRVWHAVFVAFC